ncbi:protein CNPPD1 [Uranotaenia lowii]|uniref:protein CNPPD1 n=1 Tax=Uranotaenia lowii TaxID=190385 RepID=UPI00247A4FE8|nr:protein CNPPD1 [Uranotaenia lowii]
MFERAQQSAAVNITDNKVLEHEEFLNRIKKTLYYGSSAVKCTKISRPLADYAADIFSESHRGHSLSRLNFVTVGNLTVTPCSLILAMIYLDRLNVIDPAYARRITPSELFIVSMMVSTKFYCGYDEDIYLSAWAKSGNMSVDHMKELELEFLDAIGWKIYVSNQEFFEKLKSVERVLAKRQGLTRGWLTYTELINFLPTMTMAKQILNYSTVIALSYTASVMTIAGAFFIASNINVPGNILFRSGNSSQSATDPLSASTSSGIENSSARENCSGLLTPNDPQTTDHSLTLEDCECSLQMAIESVQMLNQAYFSNNSKLQSHHRKAEFHRGRKRFVPIAKNQSGAIVDWKNFRFLFDMNANNEGDDDDETNQYDDELLQLDELDGRNCTYEEIIPLLAYGGRSQCYLANVKNVQSGGVYPSYKRTFELFSSFLKFL